MEKEVLVKSDLEKLIGPRPWPEQVPFSEAHDDLITEEDADANKSNGKGKAEEIVDSNDNDVIPDSEEVEVS